MRRAGFLGAVYAEYVFFYMKSRVILTDQSEDEVQRCEAILSEITNE